MFANAIESVGGYTRPLIYIYRNYGETIVNPGSATMFFINDEGCAVTSRHAAETILSSHNVNNKYFQFKNEKNALVNGKDKKQRLRELETKYGYKKGITVNIRCNFKGCVSPVKEITCHVHKRYDLAILIFKSFEKRMYDGYAVFADNAAAARSGDILCKMGFPIPEHINAIYNGITDDIEWGELDNLNTPRFPLSGMITRHVTLDGKLCGFEMDSLGFKGQNGGPVFDANGIVYGMQQTVRKFDTGFAFGDRLGEAPLPLYVSHCINAEVIKSFLQEMGVKYYTKSSLPNQGGLANLTMV